VVGTLTWRELTAHVTTSLGSDVDARRIVERASGYEGVEAFLHDHETVPARAASFVESMVERRHRGEPLQYVVGRWGFRRLDLLVDPRALIPRPETEAVVDVALGELTLQGLSAEGATPTVVDLGTGSGAIALALASEVPRAQVWGTDVSPAALALARANLAGTGSRVAPRVRLAAGSWFEALPPELAGTVDLVVSNPPYIAATERLPAEVADWEPSGALVAGPTGLEAMAEVVAGSPAWLARPGSLVVELAPHQAEAAIDLARRAGFDHIEIRPDLAGRPRALVGRLHGPADRVNE